MKPRELDAAQVLAGQATVAECVGLSSDELERLYAAGYRLMSQTRYREAHALFRLAALCDHTSERFWMALAACRQFMGDFLLAAESYVTAAGLNLQSPTAPVQAVFCLLRADQLEAAQVWLDEAQRRLDNRPDNVSARKCRALRSALAKRLTSPELVASS